MGKDRFYLNIILAILILLMIALPLQAYDKVKVISIVDGDTLKVLYHNREESIRLIGIDTPESIPNKKAIQDAQRRKSDIETITSQGKEAKNFVKCLVKPGDLLKIEFDIRARDKYGSESNFF